MIIIVLVIWATATYTILSNNDRYHELRQDYENLREDYKSLDSTVNTLKNADSLRLEHYKQCSFISKDRVHIGYNGYLQVKK